MIRDITIGQYYRVDSVVHRLDPRVKLVATLLFIIALFAFKSPIGIGLSIAFLVFCIFLSKVPPRFILKGLKPIFFFLAFTLIFNLFLTDGKVVVKIWKLTITEAGIYSAVTMGIRLVMLIIGSSVMTLTTTPNQLTDGVESLLGFLKVFRVPVHEVAMMMSIALRFIPILIEETDKIMKAQSARCADFESGNILHRAKNMVPILVPLFLSAFRRADDLAMAMEARCYRGGKGRTKMKPLAYHKRDAAAYAVLAAFYAVNIAVNIWI